MGQEHDAFDEAVWLRPVTGAAFSEDGTAEGYMCKTDFECELGAAKGGNVVYPSEQDLRESKPCVDSCGIVKVKVVAVEIIQESEELDW